MSEAPPVIVFDVNETLSDLSVLDHRFIQAGLPAELARLWFTTVLREGFALAASGETARFADIGANVLDGLQKAAGIGSPAGTTQRLVASMAELPLHPDVADGVRGLRAAGHRLVTLSNGSAEVAERLTESAGLEEQFEAFLSVEDAGVWKPHPGAYRYAAQRCEVPEDQVLLVAVHPWDIHGAARADLRTAWLNRTGADYPSYYTRPEITVTSLPELPAVLAPS